jgi:putative YhdH/YhfP family quinone oxidoreductase
VTYRAIVIENRESGFSAGVQDLDERELPPGEVTIRVEWSGVNWKDGQAFTPGNRVLRKYPMTPGVDLAGRVLTSTDARFAAGQAVLVTGYDLGTAHAGGFAELARVPADWVMPLPEGLTTKEAMGIGTAGLTSALSIEALEYHGLRPGNGTVIVTGATGGVGSTAVSMLAALGYTVAGSTGKAEEHDYLRELGATEVLTREEVSGDSPRSLDPERWAGAIDPVGGATTAYLARTMKAGGSIALSGLTGGAAIATTVFPFIIRGVNLLGIEAMWTPMAQRQRVWQRLATDLKPRGLMDSIAVETDLAGVAAVAAQIVAGKVRGRTLVRVG